MNPHDVVNPRCLRCRKRGSAHRLEALPPDADNTTYYTKWCHQGGAYLPQRMTDDEVERWARFLSLVYSSR